MLFDTHAHLTDEAFDSDRDALINALNENGVRFVLTCGTWLEDSLAAAQLAARFEPVYAAAGVHGQEALTAFEGYIEKLRELLKLPKVVAIGEIGLDYYYDCAPRELQKKVLLEQLELACELDIPVVLHDRDAHADMLELLRRFKGRLRGVMHCYSGSAEMVRDYMELGLYFGFGGVLTYKNAEKTRMAAAAVPEEFILLETDCPYLSPVPQRGKRNEPKNTRFTCETLAEIKGVSAEHMAQTALENGKRLFGI